MNKPFDRQLFKQNDKQARKALCKLLPCLDIRDNSNKYGVDLLVYDQNKLVAGIECERKKVWQGKKFPFDTIQFPGRKSKYVNLEIPVLFFMFNFEMDICLYVTNEDLKNSPLKMISNVFVTEGESFYQVSLNKANFLIL